jgi:hypothetical protein
MSGLSATGKTESIRNAGLTGCSLEEIKNLPFTSVMKIKRATRIPNVSVMVRIVMAFFTS